jgi:Ca-activated chloride channel family protein
MTFLRPELLWLALVLPAIVAACLLLRAAARQRAELREPQLLWLQRSRQSVPQWQRYLCVALLLVALGIIGASIAGPRSSLPLFADQRTIVLAMDVSGSMAAEDIAPTRLAASQMAANALVNESPPNMRIGLIAYGEEARVLQTPTYDRRSLHQAIDRMKADGGTAMGDGMLLALSTIFEEPSVATANLDVPDAAHSQMRTKGAKPPAQQLPAATPATAASMKQAKAAAIVLLTDGKNSDGVDPMMAAQIARVKGVKVYTVGFGTKGGVVRLGPNYSVRTPIDEPALKAIAQATDGNYFHAESGDELTRIYRDLRQRLQGDQDRTEVTALFAIAAAMLSLLSAGLSLMWFGRIA